MGKLKGISTMLVATATSAMVSTAQAATVTPVQGEVLVNAGAGYQRLGAEIMLKPGDVVIVRPDGKAMLAYPDGCTLDVVPGLVAWIEPTSPCANPHPTHDPAPMLATPRPFDRAWLLDGVALIRRHRNPAGP